MIQLFGNISGYKVNNTKSFILLLNAMERHNPIPEITCFKVVEQFGYLGVVIAPAIDQIVKINYDYLKEEINNLIDRWMNLPITEVSKSRLCQ